MSTTSDTGTGRCPAWCRREHEPRDWLNDESHATEATWVPVVALRLDWEHSPRTLHVEGIELVVAICQPTDSPEPWLCIEESEGERVRLQFSVESGHRLIRAAEEQLRRV
jgi:hypothetical protein